MHAVFEDEERVETPIREALQLVETRSPAVPSGAKLSSRIACSRQAAGNGGGGHGRLSCPSYAVLLVSVLVLVPLWFTDVLPSQQMVTFLVAPRLPHLRLLQLRGIGYGQSRESGDRHRQRAAADTWKDPGESSDD